MMLKKGTNFNRWCKENGFNTRLVQKVVNKEILFERKAEKSRRILKALKEDFPEFYKKHLQTFYYSTKH